MNTDERTKRFIKRVGSDAKFTWQETDSGTLILNLSVHEMTNAILEVNKVLWRISTLTFEDFLRMDAFETYRLPIRQENYILNRCWCMCCMEIEEALDIDYYLLDKVDKSGNLIMGFNFQTYPCDMYDQCYSDRIRTKNKTSNRS